MEFLFVFNKNTDGHKLVYVVHTYTYSSSTCSWYSDSKVFLRIYLNSTFSSDSHLFFLLDLISIVLNWQFLVALNLTLFNFSLPCFSASKSIIIMVLNCLFLKKELPLYHNFFHRWFPPTFCLEWKLSLVCWTICSRSVLVLSLRFCPSLFINTEIECHYTFILFVLHGNFGIYNVSPV